MESPESIERRIEALSRDLSRDLENVPPHEREQLRDYATELIRQQTEHPPESRVAAEQRGSWLGLLLLLLVVGLLFLVILPPVGVSALLMAGAVAALLALRAVFLGAIALTRRTTDHAEGP